MKSAVLFLMVFCTAMASAANPLGFREYQQQFTLFFDSEEAAQKAEISARGLPGDYQLAFSSRWDDSSLAHLKTHEIMRKNNIRGTFFLGSCQWVLDRKPDYVQQLQAGGCSVGLHTVTHPILLALNPNEHFYEYMKNRIDLEVISQSAVNAQVLPFCGWWFPDRKVPLSIGWAMRATGVISSPDVFFNREGELGYPPKSHAQSRFIAPGDKVPDLELFRNSMAGALNDKKALAAHPSVSMAMHSWHTDEGRRKLDQAYASIANNPSWWYCNQTEYGAYRYEAQSAAVTRKVNGNAVQFTVTRIQPLEMAADIPLWFTVSGAVPVRADGANLKNGAVELPHAAGQCLPVLFGYAAEDGVGRHMPFVRLVLRHRSENSWEAAFDTLDGKPVEQLALTFRFPSPWVHEVIRRDVGTVANITVTVTQPSAKPELYYRYGRPYYAVQADFVRDGIRCRLFADLREEAAPNLPLTASAAARTFFLPSEIDLAALSTPGTALEPFRLEEAPAQNPERVGAGVLYPGGMNGAGWEKHKDYLMVVDFKALRPGPVSLLSSVNNTTGELWLNGRRLDSNAMDITPREGVNRFVLKARKSWPVFFSLNGEREQCVEYLPAK